MKREETILPATDLAAQVNRLCRIAGQIHESLLRSLLNIPESVWDGLDILEDELAQLRRELQKLEGEHHNLEALVDIGSLVNSSLELNEVLRIVMDTIVRLTSAERGFLMLREDDGHMSIQVARNWEQESINAPDYTLSSTVVSQVLEEGVPVLTTNARQDPRFGGLESVIAYDLHSILCVPLKVKGEVTGVIYADNRVQSGIFTEAELNLLNAFANQAAVAIENARLFDSVRRSLVELTEKKRLEAQHRLFARMLSPAIIDQLDPDSVPLAGERVQVTTMFADVRGFTGFSEDHDPVQLVSVLNLYLAAATNAILAHQGTVDKFLGDAVMAWFNAPIPQPDHTLKAIQAALMIHEATRRVHDDLPPEFRLSFGIGIHSGEAVLGLVGSETRMEYTAVGDSVNTARRIQENAQPGQILISADAYALVTGKVDVHPVGPIYVKGKRLPVEVFEVISI